jgi:hypothetical protein
MQLATLSCRHLCGTTHSSFSASRNTSLHITVVCISARIRIPEPFDMTYAGHPHGQDEYVMLGIEKFPTINSPGHYVPLPRKFRHLSRTLSLENARRERPARLNAFDAQHYCPHVALNYVPLTLAPTNQIDLVPAYQTGPLFQRLICR